MVGLAAVAAVAIAIGVTLATRTSVQHHRATAPPFLSDPTATRAVRAAVREALRAWPSGTVRRLRALAVEHPRSALVRLELGLALRTGGNVAGARRAWRDAA